MSYAKVIIIGYLGRTPELRYTPQGNAVCNFSVATSEKFRNREGEQQERTTWFKITVFGKQAENASKYLDKGRQVYVEGNIHTSEWTDREGVNRTSLEVNAQVIQYLSTNDSGGRSDGQHDQRRRGPDENERSQEPVRANSVGKGDIAGDTLSLDEEIPF